MTITCDPNWREIQQGLLRLETSWIRSELVDRIFNQKKEQIINDIRNKDILGVAVADVHVIEFQKRGLPHMHLLLLFLLKQIKL